MDPNVLNELGVCLQNTLSPDASIRRAAERMLQNGESQRGFPIMLLMLAKAENQSNVVQITAAVSFKNFVKKHWRVTENRDDVIGDDIREQIRNSIIEIMLSSGDKIQKQICETIGLIGIRDFPKRWPDLVSQLASHLSSTGRTDIRTAKGILQTASSLFSRYRNEFQTEDLIREILLVLQDFAQVFTDFTTSLVSAVMEAPQSVTPDMLNCLHLIADIFYSLNCQDLPEFFEINMQTWMAHFDKLLKLQLPGNLGEPSDGRTLDEVKSAVCESVAMYAQKYSEEFSPYLPTFVTDIWQVLEAAGQKAKCDQLASTAIQFLASIADRPAYANLFAAPNALQSICENVVLPNLYFRDEDEEDFEDNPEQYIRADLEGADADTRRRAACELVKALNRSFEAQLVTHFSAYIVGMLNKYLENKTANWKCKDSAIYLVTSIASKGQTQKYGTTKASELVNIQDFYTQHILPDIADPDVNSLPVIKADGLKFVVTFRGQLSTEQLFSAIPCAIALLQSKSIVVMSYAAHLLERLFIMKATQADGVSRAIVPAEFLDRHADRLFSTICNSILTRPETAENVYAVRALLRAIWLLEERALPRISTYVLGRLSERIVSISRNPSRPEFNHYLFETVCVCCHVACRKAHGGVSALSALEKALLPSFQIIVQGDVQEFLPYVFQVLTLMLDYNEPGKISPTYMAMLPFFMQPVYWERTGNIPALTLLVQAYVEKSPAQITDEQVVGMLGIFQKLVMNKTHDHDAFRLLTALVSHIPANRMQGNIKGIFTIILQRLSTSKTPKFIRGLLLFLSTFVRLPGWGGGDFLVDVFNQIQQNLFGMLVERVFLVEANKVQGWPARFRIAKGLAGILASARFAETYRAQWPNMVELAVQLVESQQDQDNDDENEAFAGDIEEMAGYEAAFSQLAFASRRGGESASGTPVPVPSTGSSHWESFAKAQAELRADLTKAVSTHLAKVAASSTVPVAAAFSPGVKSALVSYGVPLATV